MRAFIRNSMILSVLVGVAAAVGCSSSDDSSGGGAGAGGSAGSHAGSSQGGGSAGKGATNGGNAGAGGEATAGAADGGGGPIGGAADGGAADGGAADGGAANGGANAGGEGGGLAETAGAGGEPSVSAACNSVVQSGPIITVTSSAGAAPVLAQGSIQAGTYYLTSYTFYVANAVDPVPVAGTLVVTVNNNTATLNATYAQGAYSDISAEAWTETIQIVMGAPTTVAPTSVIASCSQGIFQDYVGKELKSAVSYGVTGTGGDTLTLLTAGSNEDILLAFKLKP